MMSLPLSRFCLACPSTQVKLTHTHTHNTSRAQKSKLEHDLYEVSAGVELVNERGVGQEEGEGWERGAGRNWFGSALDEHARACAHTHTHSLTHSQVKWADGDESDKFKKLNCIRRMTPVGVCGWLGATS
jgi:hypothetical protein